jgi:hypothetical protein
VTARMKTRELKAPWGGNEVFGNIDGQLEALEEAIRAEASTNNDNRARCVRCMVHYTEGLYEVGARRCGGCQSREERCMCVVE